MLSPGEVVAFRSLLERTGRAVGGGGVWHPHGMGGGMREADGGGAWATAVGKAGAMGEEDATRRVGHHR